MLTPSQSPSLTSLPAELVLEILETMPDPQSLTSAALSCRSLYTIFKHHERELVKATLVTCVGRDVLPEAIMVHRCNPPMVSDIVTRQDGGFLPREMEDALDAYVSRFMDNNMDRDEYQLTNVSTAEAVKLAKFHTNTVSHLIAEFCGERFGYVTWPERYPMPDDAQSPSTEKERARVTRAFYRFELFRKLLGLYSQRADEMSRKAQDFLFKFSPWEINQLANVQYFLQFLINIPFGTMARNASRCVDGAAYQEEIEHLMSLGLEWIVDLTTAEDPDQGLGLDPWHATRNSCFLGWVLSSWDPEYPKNPKSFFDDGDDGPEEAYRVLERVGIDVASLPLKEVCRLGYPFWDKARLEALGMLQGE